MVAHGTVDQVIEQADIDLVITFTTDHDIRPLLRSLPNIGRVEQNGSLVHVSTGSEQTLTDLVMALSEAQVAYRKIKIAYPELEDAFLKLVNSTAKGAVS